MTNHPVPKVAWPSLKGIAVVIGDPDRWPRPRNSILESPHILLIYKRHRFGCFWSFLLACWRVVRLCSTLSWELKLSGLIIDRSPVESRRLQNSWDASWLYSIPLPVFFLPSSIGLYLTALARRAMEGLRCQCTLSSWLLGSLESMLKSSASKAPTASSIQRVNAQRPSRCLGRTDICFQATTTQVFSVRRNVVIL